MNIDPELFARLVLCKDEVVGDAHAKTVVAYQPPRRCVLISKADADTLNALGISSDILHLELHETYGILWDPAEYKAEYEYSIEQEARRERRKLVEAMVAQSSLVSEYVNRINEDPAFAIRGRKFWKDKIEVLYRGEGLEAVKKFMHDLGDVCYGDATHFIED